MSTRTTWLSRLPALGIAAAALAGLILFRDQLDFQALADNRAALLAFRDGAPVLSVLVFVAAYTAIVALSLPGATVATLTGGFLFGLFPGVLWNVAGASAGAMLLFLAVRAGFGRALAARIDAGGGRVAQVKAALDRNQWSALFLMRLLPVVPFFVANLLPALLNVPFHRHAVTTVLGILPGALILTSVGAGLGGVLDRGAAPDLSVLRSPAVLLPILGLCALAALPLVLKVIRR
jgi:uncharacterized membrane protein YdjX (TVP38/TMEM64 family)